MFNKITLIDDCRLTDEILEKLALLSRNPISVYTDTPATEAESIERIKDSDCVLVSWRTPITAAILAASSQLKYIAMCCSLYNEKAANVDISKARELGIAVKGVRDYGDEGVVEFMFAQLINLFKGFGPYQWRKEPTELTNKSIGIIGLGTLGTMVAQTARHFGMQPYYYSRTKKETDIPYLSLEELVNACDVITTHVPKHTVVLTRDLLEIKKKNSVLINTSLGLTFDKEGFTDWLTSDPTSYAIFDSDGAGVALEEFSKRDRIILYNRTSGMTTEARQRLSQKVVENLNSFLGK